MGAKRRKSCSVQCRKRGTQSAAQTIGDTGLPQDLPDFNYGHYQPVTGILHPESATGGLCKAMINLHKLVVLLGPRHVLCGSMTPVFERSQAPCIIFEANTCKPEHGVFVILSFMWSYNIFGFIYAELESEASILACGLLL
jgi:hypothetical protein